MSYHGKSKRKKEWMEEIMTGNYNVVSKGQYLHKQTSEALRIERFLIIRKRKRRMVLLEFNNLTEEKLTALKLRVEQYDVKGNSLGTVSKEWKKVSVPSGVSLFKKPIGVNPACVEIRVNVEYAECGNFVYRLGGDGSFITFEKQEPRKKLSESVVRNKTGKDGFAVEHRKFGAPAGIAVCTALLLIVSATIAAIQILDYEEKDTFFLNSLEYEFVDGEYSEDGAVYITGFVSNGIDVLTIPNQVDGHHVAGIRDNAFSDNSMVKNVTIEEGIVVSEGAFQNCYQLESVELKGNNRIQPYAFSNCTSLRSVKAHDLQKIGKEAFANTYNLQSLRITSSDDDESVLEISANAFTNSYYFTEIYIDDYVAYDKALFQGTASVSSLYLKNYNYSVCEKNTDKKIYDLFGSYYTGIQSLEIANMDKIPQSFAVSNGALDNVKIGNLTETTIGKEAFAYCYELNSFSSSEAITQIGDSAFKNASQLETFDFAKIESIGEGAFESCTSLQTIDLEKGKLKTLSPAVFKNCSALAEIKFPVSLKTIEREALYGCKALRELDFPDNLEGIEYNAVGAATGLRYVKLPASLKQVDISAFEYCYHLHEIENLSSEVSIVAGEGIGAYTLKVYTSATEPRIEKYESQDMRFGNVDGKYYALEYLGTANTYTFPDNVQGNSYALTSYLFYETYDFSTVRISSGVTKLADFVFAFSKVQEIVFDGTEVLEWNPQTFQYTYGVEKIDFGNRQTDRIYAYAFRDFDWLVEVNLSPKITNIGEGAFASCDSLQKVTGGVNVDLIGMNAFQACYALTNYTFGDKLLGIDAYAFADCYQLQEVVLPECLMGIGEKSFSACNQLTQIHIPSGVTEIGAYAFDGCWSLLSVTGGNNVRSIGVGAFMYCEKLEYFPFSSSLNTLGSFAFGYCSSLKEAQLPSGLTVIPDNAFVQCFALEKIYLPTSLTAIRDNAFYGCNRLHEVYNFSNLELFCDSTAHGYVGYNAIVIHKDSSETLKVKETKEGLVFKYLGGTRAIVDYTGEESSLALDSKYYTSYIIARYAFEGCATLEELTIGSAVTDIRTLAFTGAYNLRSIRFETPFALTIKSNTFNDCSSLTTLLVSTNLKQIEWNAFAGAWGLNVYYEQDQEHWDTYGCKAYDFSNMYYNLYYYDTCAHYDHQWKYDGNNAIDTSNKDFSNQKIIRKATCTGEGNIELSCSDCKETSMQYVPPLGHTLKGYQCIRCDYISMSVTKDTLANAKNYLTFTNESKNAFDLFQTSSDTIYAPDEDGIESTFTITAKEDLYVNFMAYKGDSSVGLRVEYPDGEQTVYTNQWFSILLKKGQSITINYKSASADSEKQDVYLKDLHITSLE